MVMVNLFAKNNTLHLSFQLYFTNFQVNTCHPSDISTRPVRRSRRRRAKLGPLETVVTEIYPSFSSKASLVFGLPAFNRFRIFS